MHRRKPGKVGYLAACCFALLFASHGAAQQIHRNGFEGKQPYWLRGESNVKADERSHSITDANAHRGTTSEQIIVSSEVGKNDSNTLYYTYKTPQAPICDELTISLYVRGNKAGVQLLARVVLPRERDPDNIGEPLTVLITGDNLKQTRAWQRLDVARPRKLLSDEQQKLRTSMKKDIDLTDAYVDRLILNLYTGAGTTEVQIDDLEISPVMMASVAAPTINGEKSNGPDLPKGQVTPPGGGNPQPLMNIIRSTRGQLSKFEGQRLRVGEQPFFFRAIRYPGTDLKQLKDMGFNTIFLDAGADQKVIDEAVGNGLWLIPQMPLIGEAGNAQNQLTSLPKNGDATSGPGRNVEALTVALTKYARSEGVLFYDLGPGRATEQISQVSRTAEAIRASDPTRPRSADVWDGFRRYSTQVEMISTHRNPLMTSLELTSYRDFLTQRGKLAGESVFTWSWIQTHVPDWQAKLIYGKNSADEVNEGFSPTPEQIRLLTYLSIASGSKGLGFWSDRQLADPTKGKERLLMMALLNQELMMLEPVLQSVRSAPQWYDVQGRPEVKFAVLRGEKGILVIPIWLGAGSQYVPPQGAVADLTIVVPLIQDGMSAWEISPGRVQMLQKDSKSIVGGTKIVIPEFDLTTAIVFTNDLNPDGLAARWQDHSRKVARQSAEWAVEMAAAEYERVKRQYTELDSVGPVLEQAGQLLTQSQTRIEQARNLLAMKKDELAYLEATRALRPLRILTRAQWEMATKPLDFASSSPFAVSYQTLPQHYKLKNQLREMKLGGNALVDGDFENGGAHIVQTSASGGSQLPRGWSTQQASLDQVDLVAEVVSSKIAATTPPPPAPEVKRDRYVPSSRTRIPDKSEPDQPELGKNCLRLAVSPKKVVTNGKKAYAPAILERTFLAVHSPPMRLQPGTWVRVSGWVYIPEPIKASADGVLIYDSVAGESLGLRMADVTKGWKSFHMYRKVPETGTVWLTVAMTGLGQVFVDDLKIEPYAEGTPERAMPELDRK